jgi:hypothetical protein
VNVIACNPVKGSPLPSVIGSRTVPCANCKADVWASPATQKMLQDKENRPYCLTPCAPIKLLEMRVKTQEQVEFRGVEGWEDEARPLLGEQGVNEVKAFLDELNESTRDSE